MREWLLSAAIVLVLLGGVAGAVTTDDEGTDAPVSEAAVLDAGVVRDRVDWVLAFVNDGIGEAEIPAIFSSQFLASVPASQIVALATEQLRPAGPFIVESIERQTSSTAVLVVAGPTGERLRLSIALDEADRIESLLFQPAEAPLAKPASWDDLDEQLAAAAPAVAFLAAEVVDGECRPVHGVDQDRVLPVGSAFKLYVLGAAADAVASGTASWDDVLTVTDERRVHSSMTYGSAPAGTKVSLRDAAAAMISVSDNTATDLVMEHVGRVAVEAQQAVMGVADPSRNEPFLTTRELTYLKWIVGEAQREEYIAGDRARREEILAALPDRGATPEDATAASNVSTALDIEWFASPMDLCRAHVALQTKGEEVRRILAINAGSGLAFDRDALPYIGFKGGSEAGVLGMAWYAEHRDGRRLFVGALLRNDHDHVRVGIVRSVAAAFDLFG